jgi:thioredoxin-like negative regulator of GroEL
VSSLTLIALWTVAVGAPEADSYDQAHQATMETGKPMVVMVTTDWCAPCQVMKKTVIPQVRQRGLLSRVAFAIVNPDRERDLAQRLIGGGPVPQLIMFRKTAGGWKRQQLVGGQSVESVEQFINEGIAKDQEEAKAADETPKDQTAKKAPPAEDEAQTPQEHHVAAH